MNFIDTHLHYWDRDRFHYGWLDATAPTSVLPQQLPARADRAGAIFVQADCDRAEGLEEARWAAGLPGVSAVIAFAPVEHGGGVISWLEALHTISAVRGVRRLLQDAPDELLLDAQTIVGLRRVGSEGFVFDACVRARQLPSLTRLAAAVPETTIVLDHLGKPPVAAGIQTEPGRAWMVALQDLAQLPNVHVKLSGLAAEADQDVPLDPQARPFLHHALETFGGNRCLIGSDWPVSTRDAAGYDSWISLVDELGASTDERARILADNAISTYALDLTVPGA